MEESKDILACPFCGKPAQLTEEGRGQYKVTCSFVGACYGNWRPDYSTPEAAINRWNMRAGAHGRVTTDGSRFAACGGSAAAWKDLAIRLAEEAQVVIDNAHWEVAYGSGDLLGTIKTVRELQRSESTQPPNHRL